MTIEAIASIVESFRAVPLLTAVQLDELSRDLALRFADSKALAGELIQRGWITPFQANRLLQGKGRELLLGSYLLLERIGRGGMGEVYRARHVLMGRVVALKIIREEFLTRPAAIGRFQQEIQAASKVAHPNVVLSYDASRVGDTYILIMEHVEGIDLAQLLRGQGRLPVGEACDYLRQAALGLQHIHECGLIHRDIKPSNLLLRRQDAVLKVLDLGLSRLRAEGEGDAGVVGLTQEGDVMGTPDYLAPEQARDSRSVDIRADIYSLGCTGYHLLTGRPPFPGGSLTEKLLKHQQAEPPSLQQFVPVLPAGLEAVVQKMLAKRPEDRYQIPAEVAAALQPFARAATAARAVPEANQQADAEGAHVHTGSYHSPEHETKDSAAIPLAKPASTEPAPLSHPVWAKFAPALVFLRDRFKKRRLFWSATLVGALSVGVVALCLAIRVGHGRPADTPMLRTVNPPAPPDAEPEPAEKPIAWHKETHALLTGIMAKGMNSSAAYMAYTKLMDALDRGEDNEVVIGGGLTQDHKFYAVGMKSGQLTSRQILAEEIKGRKLQPQSIGEGGEEPLALHGGQLVTLEKPQLQVRRESSGALIVAGRIGCRSSDKQRLSDVSLMLRRRFRKDNHLVTLTTYQHLDLTETPSGALKVRIDLPTEQQLSPEEIGAVAENRVDLLLIAFAFEPRPRLYEISNTYSLTIVEGQLAPDPNRLDGWNQEALHLVKKIVTGEERSFLHLRVYSDLTTALQDCKAVLWTLGGEHTRNGRPYMVKVAQGKLAEKEPTEDEARELKIGKGELRQSSNDSFQLRYQPLLVFSQENLRATKGKDILRLVGRVHSTALNEQALRHSLLLIRYASRQKEGAKPSSPNHNAILPLTLNQTPSGWIELEAELPADVPPGSRALLHLEAFLSWPQPCFYRISNKLPFTIPQPAP